MRHQVTRQLLRWFDVLFVEFLPGRSGGAGGERIEEPCEGLQVFRPCPPFRVSPRAYAMLPWAHWYVNRWYRDRILALVTMQPRIATVLVSFANDFPEIMRTTPFSAKYYLCCDEFPRMWRRRHRPNALRYGIRWRVEQRYENQVAKNACRCLASHTSLVEKLGKENPRASLFLHGHEFLEEPNFRRRRLRDQKIRVAFMGFITYNLMPEWLRAVTGASDMELYLIGPILRFDVAELGDDARVKCLGPMEGRELLAALAGMDVLVMPYNPQIPEVRVQTASNKFFQYIASGRPVVISDMPSYLDMPEGVLYRARTPEEFVLKIRQADREDCDEYVNLRLEIAKENTWDRRGTELHEMLEMDLGMALSPVMRRGNPEPHVK